MIYSVVFVGAEAQICILLKGCGFRKTSYDCMEGGKFLQQFSFTGFYYWLVEGIRECKVEFVLNPTTRLDFFSP